MTHYKDFSRQKFSFHLTKNAFFENMQDNRTVTEAKAVRKSSIVEGACIFKATRAVV